MLSHNMHPKKDEDGMIVKFVVHSGVDDFVFTCLSSTPVLEEFRKFSRHGTRYLVSRVHNYT